MKSKVVSRILRLIKASYRSLFKVRTLRLHGVVVQLTHNNISPALKSFFYNETYESAEIAILRKHLQYNDVVIEIGAGIGFLSTFCALKIGSTKVFAFEANPYMIPKIRETYKLNQVTPLLKNNLLSDEETSVKFYLEKDFWSSSTIKRSESSDSVLVKSLDINDEINKINPSLLIVDIEGGEMSLIPMINFDDNNISRIIIEIHPRVIGSKESSKVLHSLFSHEFYINFEDSQSNVFILERSINI